MVHSSDNETALYQELDYLQVKEMVCVRILPLTMNPFFFFCSFLALGGNCSPSVERECDNSM